MMIRLSKRTKCRTHIVHLSSSNSIPVLKQAIENGVKISVETCPQYLFFNAEEIPDNDPRYKCAPPIREKENNDKLWGAVKRGLISFIVTDHSPAPPDIKELDSGNVAKAWGGISSLELSLPVVWTKARERGFKIEDMARLMSENVAVFLSLDKKKGKIQKGMDADLMIWNPEDSFIADQSKVHYRHKISPYHGQKLYGVVRTSILNGSIVYDNGNFLSLRQGKLIIR
jgi:allantoinase